MRGRTLWITFIFWPLLGFILAWRNITERSSQKVVLAFYSLFGLLYVVNPLMDGARRADLLAEVHLKSFSEFFYYFDTLFESTTDFLDQLIIYSVSRFTDFHGLLFATYALLFGWFSIAYLRLLLSRLNRDNLNFKVLLFLWLLVWVNSVFNIGGFRMWMAGWIFSLGVLNYMIYGGYKPLLLASVSVFMHFSYLPLILILGGYYFLGNRTVLYAIIAIITFFIGELDIESFKKYGSYLAPAFERKVDAYTGEEYIESRKNDASKAAWFIVLSGKSLLYFSVISLILPFQKLQQEFSGDRLLTNMYNYTLLLLAFSNVAVLVPSGGRFRTIFYIFAFSSLAYYFNRTDKKKSTVYSFVGLGIAVLFTLITFRVGSDTFNAMLLTPSFMLPLGFIEPITLKELLF